MYAREMVFYIRRAGSDRQNGIYLEYRTRLHQGVHGVQDWLTSRFTESVTFDEMAGL
jgi:transcriptional regulator GlxA family with amidase domain